MNESNLQGCADDQECNRLITREGIVIRQYPNMDVDLLFPDGVHAVFSKKEL